MNTLALASQRSEVAQVEIPQGRVIDKTPGIPCREGTREAVNVETSGGTNALTSRQGFEPDAKRASCVSPHHNR